MRRKHPSSKLFKKIKFLHFIFFCALTLSTSSLNGAAPLERSMGGRFLHRPIAQLGTTLNHLWQRTSTSLALTLNPHMYVPWGLTLFSQKRFISGGRYMTLPPTPDWLLHHKYSEEVSEEVLDLHDESWIPHYNKVDDCVCYIKKTNEHSVVEGMNKTDLKKVDTTTINRVSTTMLEEPPYNATGLIRTKFQTEDCQMVMCGSSAVINGCIGLSAAHLFLPRLLNTTDYKRSYPWQTTLQLQHNGDSTGVLLKVLRYLIHPGWNKDLDPNFDLAVLLLVPLKERSDVNKLQLYFIPPEQCINQDLFVVGYPTSQQELNRRFMCVSNGKCIGCLRNLLYYDAESTCGNSGGPVVLGRNKSDKLVAIHTRGDVDMSHTFASGGVALSTMEDFINSSINRLLQFPDFKSEINDLIARKYPSVTLNQEERSFVEDLHDIRLAENFLKIKSKN